MYRSNKNHLNRTKVMLLSIRAYCYYYIEACWPQTQSRAAIYNRYCGPIVIPWTWKWIPFLSTKTQKFNHFWIWSIYFDRPEYWISREKNRWTAAMSNTETVCASTHTSNEIAVGEEDEVKCSMVLFDRASTVQRRTMACDDQSLTRICCRWQRFSLLPRDVREKQRHNNQTAAFNFYY